MGERYSANPAMENRFSLMFPEKNVKGSLGSRFVWELNPILVELLTEATGKGFDMQNYEAGHTSELITSSTATNDAQLACLNAAKEHLEIHETVIELEIQRKMLYDREYYFPECTICVVWAFSAFWTLGMWFLVIYYAIHLDSKPQWASAGLLSECVRAANEQLTIPAELNNQFIRSSLPPKWIEGLAFPDNWGVASRLLVSTVFSMFYNWIILDPLFEIVKAIYKIRRNAYSDKSGTRERWHSFKYYTTLDEVLTRASTAKAKWISSKPAVVKQGSVL